ncbi:hypothetical protein [Desulfobacter postgatei]|jgi:hypothetical protein|uniref:hypothetical protein n=1 Tax=Desulfobacter postgatei TaxID=2293 RepID=UPI002A36841A|nr:hypothetical protein [Desulfobacter postgatei]MDX9964845.1 hypothetical protein [Desulfobacter postgatei]
MKAPRTCVTPQGQFVVGIHKPGFDVDNFRQNSTDDVLGRLPDGRPVKNLQNYPQGQVQASADDRIYEIANAFPFRGSTFINSDWADRKAERPDTICLPARSDCSLSACLKQWQKGKGVQRNTVTQMLELLPRPLKLALAQASTDPEELCALAGLACDFVYDNGKDHPPTGLSFGKNNQGWLFPVIHDHDLYDVLGNNPALPDVYKEVMVLKPGIQGDSPIVGESLDNTHVFEYMRANSYIPWGHYATNMANDQIRYRANDLTPSDMAGMRHLYYQRIYVRLAQMLGVTLPATGRPLSTDELEALRMEITDALVSGDRSPLDSESPFFTGALWGWNFGFGFAQSGHRLHASHQMIHQQNAMIPESILDSDGNPYPCFACGDLVADFIRDYKAVYNTDFFTAFIKAIKNNQRTDMNPDGPNDLVVWENNKVMLFAPKAQVSEWELMLMTKSPCPHVLSADTATRNALDTGIRIAVQTLETLGAQMVTSVEFSGRFNSPVTEQHLVYSFIPRLPYAPGTFSEAQMRFIAGCFPEDFAFACRKVLSS